MAFAKQDNFKLIIFDLDGTLVDAYQSIESSFNFTMQSLGLPLKGMRVIRKSVGWGDEMLLAPFVPKSLLVSAVKIYRVHHKKALIDKAKLLSGARELLVKLSRKYYLAVASNRPRKFSQVLLNTLKIKKYFNFCLCADSLKRAKPHPLILKKIINRFSLKPREALYVGDMAIDAQTARRAKIKAVIVRGGSSTLGEIKKERPWRIISQIKELNKIIS